MSTGCMLPMSVAFATDVIRMPAKPASIDDPNRRPGRAVFLSNGMLSPSPNKYDMAIITGVPMVMR